MYAVMIMDILHCLKNLFHNLNGLVSRHWPVLTDILLYCLPLYKFHRQEKIARRVLKGFADYAYNGGMVHFAKCIYLTLEKRTIFRIAGNLIAHHFYGNQIPRRVTTLIDAAHTASSYNIVITILV